MNAIMDPLLVGNDMRLLVSDMAGRASAHAAYQPWMSGGQEKRK